MQMIYLLHSTFDEALMKRLQRALDHGFRRGRENDVKPTANDNGTAFEVVVSDEELAGDLHFGRAA